MYIDILLTNYNNKIYLIIQCIFMFLHLKIVPICKLNSMLGKTTFFFLHWPAMV